jgi:hypothetical protein
MKKMIPLLLIITASISCSRNDIYKEYQEINQLWYLQKSTELPIVSKELTYIDFGQCKISKKLARNESAACSASINDSSTGGLTMSFKVKTENILEIIDIRNHPLNGGDGIGIYEPSPLEIDLNNELKGTWTYNISSETFEIINGSKKITFNK